MELVVEMDRLVVVEEEVCWLTWHLVGGVGGLSGLRGGEARAVTEPRLQGRLTLGQAPLCLDARQHHPEI